MPSYWLLKSEPNVFGIDDLRRLPTQTEGWDGVRNYQARNFLRDQMQVGDLGYFYHSNCKEPGIVGIVEIVSAGYPDAMAFDPTSRYYDAKSTPAHPRWYQVDVKFKQKFSRTLTLTELKQQPELKNMPLVCKGNRLSVMPVTPEEWKVILQLANRV